MRDAAARTKVVPVQLQVKRTDDALLGERPLQIFAVVLAIVIGVIEHRPGRPRSQIAIISASLTGSLLMSARIDQPTTLRENRLRTTAT